VSGPDELDLGGPALVERPAPTDARISALDLARAGLVVSGAYLASRVLGYVRVAVIGTTFGASSDLDAFFTAFRIPDLIFQLVAAGAVASAVVPIVAGLLAGGQQDRAWRVVSSVANLMLIGLAVLAGLAFIGAPLIVPLIASGFSGAQLERTIDLTRLMLLGPVFLALGAVATSALNSQQRFAAAAVAPVAYNLVIIAAAVFLAAPLGVEGLALGVVGGGLASLLIQLPSLFRGGFRYHPSIDGSDQETRRALGLMVPRAVALGAGQITFVVATSLATGLATGSVTAFTFAFTVFTIPIGVIGIPLGVVVLPSLSRDLAVGDVRRYADLVGQALRLVLFAMLPIVVLGVVLSREAVTVLFDHGAFSDRDVTLVQGALVVLLWALPGEASTSILARAFFADRDTRTPAAAAVLAVVINVVVAVIAVAGLGLGLPGIALGIACGSSIEPLVLLVIFRRRSTAFRLPWVGSVIGPVVIGTAAAGIAAWLVAVALHGLLGGLAESLAGAIDIVVAGGAGLLVYAGLTAALRVPELGLIVGLMTDSLAGLRRR
jgi:putative peptidoglycan lipid II flippase